MENSIVRKSNYLIEASYRLSFLEQKLILALVTSIKSEDKDFKEYSLKIKDFLEFLGNERTNYGKIIELVEGLQEKTLRVSYPDEDGKNVRLQLSWLSSTKYTAGSGFINLRFDPNLKPFLLQLKSSFTNYRLGNIIRLGSQYSIRIYELLKQYEKCGRRDFYLKELRETLGIEEGEYSLYANFKMRAILIPQKELAENTDLTFTFDEIKIGRAVGKIRFFIKPKARKVHELSKVEDAQVVVKSLETEIPESEDMKKLLALLPQERKDKESIRKLLKTWLDKKSFDYVARNIEYSNAKSNEVKPGLIPGKGSNYRNYLAKTLNGDFGMAYQEDQQVNRKAEEYAKRKAQEAAAIQKQQSEQAQNEKEDHKRVRAFQQNLSPEALEQLKTEAFSRLNMQSQEIVEKKAVGSELLLKIMMDKITLKRIKISKESTPKND